MPLDFINVAVCDDNEIFLSQIAQKLDLLLAERPHKIYSFSDSDSLLASMDTRTYSIYILDIQFCNEIPGNITDGIILGKEIEKAQPHSQIIFLTAYNVYAQDVYAVNHVAFVLKRDLDIYLPRALNKALEYNEYGNSIKFSLTVSGALQMVDIKKILYLERKLHSTKVHLTYTLSNEKETKHYILNTSEKLESLVDRLNLILHEAGIKNHHFIQCHKSFAVNWHHVSRYSTHEIVLADHNSIVLPISRNRINQVRESFLLWNGNSIIN